ncbi:sigma-70 family RNA polymerase sigma factor [Altererythrobacter sp. ZODW24]|uniref:RNA polymerase sigma factor n=1 Tax=Altererythrobacter sp. ZODW24 TaxID=2185142 RepID=UPI000DF7A42D|nr:sigma-70 family RNA polymerase sigma factor [Altererythrobacter sp. ZODW24]
MDQNREHRAEGAKRRSASPAAGAVYDELLVTMIWSGDRQASQRLAARWQPRLIHTARRLLGDREQAQSAVQESWLSIMRSIHSLRDPAKFAPWAFGILHRRCSDAIRSNQRGRAHVDNDAEIEGVTDPQGDDGIAIRQAFALLSPDHRITAQLFFVEGLTLAEIAEVADVPTGTIKSRLFHARQHLKAALTGDDT